MSKFIEGKIRYYVKICMEEGEIMKNNIKNFIAICTVVSVILLAACQNSSDKSSAVVDDQSQNNSSSQNKNDESSNVDSTEDAANTENASEKVDTPRNEPEKEKVSSIETTANVKDDYLKKLSDTKTATDKMEATDTSTFALKKVENDRWELWDALLNEVYGVLNEQLSTEDMDQLRQEQRDWIKYRDDSALEASKKYKGGTQEHLEYVAVLADLTEERCYELVEDYL